MKSPLLNFSIVSVVVILAIGGYVWWGIVIGGVSDRALQLESDIAAKTQAISSIASARASLTEIAGREASMRSYFVPETGVVAFISEIESSGRGQGASVSVLSVSASGSATQPSLTLALTIKGSFDAVMRTVGAIEFSPHDISVLTLAVTREGKGWSGNLTLNVGSVPAQATSSSTPTTP